MNLSGFETSLQSLYDIEVFYTGFICTFIIAPSVLLYVLINNYNPYIEDKDMKSFFINEDKNFDDENSNLTYEQLPEIFKSTFPFVSRLFAPIYQLIFRIRSGSSFLKVFGVISPIFLAIVLIVGVISIQVSNKIIKFDKYHLGLHSFVFSDIKSYSLKLDSIVDFEGNIDNKLKVATFIRFFQLKDNLVSFEDTFEVDILKFSKEVYYGSVYKLGNQKTDFIEKLNSKRQLVDFTRSIAFGLFVSFILFNISLFQICIWTWKDYRNYIKIKRQKCTKGNKDSIREVRVKMKNRLIGSIIITIYIILECCFIVFNEFMCPPILVLLLIFGLFAFLFKRWFEDRAIFVFKVNLIVIMLYMASLISWKGFQIDTYNKAYDFYANFTDYYKVPEKMKLLNLFKK